MAAGCGWFAFITAFCRLSASSLASTCRCSPPGASGNARFVRATPRSRWDAGCTRIWSSRLRFVPVKPANVTRTHPESLSKHINTSDHALREKAPVIPPDLCRFRSSDLARTGRGFFEHFADAAVAGFWAAIVEDTEQLVAALRGRHALPALISARITRERGF